MSYMKIDNLYKNQEILMFKEGYALEKVHGTSAHVTWKDGALSFFSGGVSHEAFVALFDQAVLVERFTRLNYPEVTVYGEAYGGKCQGMSKVYGEDLKFIVFEIKVEDKWLNVINAEDLATQLGFRYVPYVKIPLTMEAINAERDRTSSVALLFGMGEHPREGIVLRPLIELTKNNGQRVIAKYKTEAFKETRTSRVVGEDLQVLTEATAIADEWVTPMRLTHVLDKIEGEKDITKTKAVIDAMFEDIRVEAGDEAVLSSAAKKVIGKKTAQLYKAYLINDFDQKVVRETV